MYPSFRYLPPDPARITVTHNIPALDGNLLVLANLDEIVHEWAFYLGGECVAHSDSGFGSPEAALRAGLNEVLG